jgi:hypothetical protein
VCILCRVVVSFNSRETLFLCVICFYLFLFLLVLVSSLTVAFFGVYFSTNNSMNSVFSI